MNYLLQLKNLSTLLLMNWKSHFLLDSKLCLKNISDLEEFKEFRSEVIS